MKASKFSEAQIAFVLKQAEDGTAIGEVCRKAVISRSCPIAWCSFWLPLTAFGLARAVDVMPTQLAG